MPHEKLSIVIPGVGAFFTLATLNASAHPGSGIAVDKQGNVYFNHTGLAVGRIDAQGKVNGSRDEDGSLAFGK